MSTTLTSDLCNEVRDLREQLAKANRKLAIAKLGIEPRHGLLRAILDAGRPHSHLCSCDMCNAWLAVRKELRGE